MIRPHPPETLREEFQRLLADRNAAQDLFNWADPDHVDVAIRRLAHVEEALAVAMRLARQAQGGAA